MRCIIMLFNIDDIQCGAGTANSCRLYHVKYNQLSMYSRFGRGQNIIAFGSVFDDTFLNIAMINVGCNYQPHQHNGVSMVTCIWLSVSIIQM